jgi:hypothetical protein
MSINILFVPKDRTSDFGFTISAQRHTLEKALRKRDARNAQALRLAHVSAGGGVPGNVEA